MSPKTLASVFKVRSKSLVLLLHWREPSMQCSVLILKPAYVGFALIESELGFRT